MEAKGRRALVYGIVTALLVPAVAFGFAELGVRLMDLRPRRLEFPRYRAQAEDGRWIEHGTWARGLIKRPSPYPEVEMGEYVPGASFRILYPSDPRGHFDEDGGVAATINSLGLRGAEVSKEKREGTFRILGIGDSFTFGVGVRDDETYLSLLQGILNGGREGEDGPVFEVLNAGVGGYNTRDEVLYLERRWLDLEPDMVLIGFYLNDVYSERTFLTPQEMQSYEPRGMARVSHLWDLFQYRRWSRRVRRQVESFYRSHYFENAGSFLENPENKGKIIDWSVSRSVLERAVALAREKGFSVALVLFPTLYELDGDYPFEDVHQVVMESCREMSLPALDLLDLLRGENAEELWVHPRDHHPNREAHRLIAGAIAAFLADPSHALLPAAP